MIELLLLAGLLAVVFGRHRLVAGLRRVTRVWRTTAGLLSVLALVAAAVLAVRNDPWPAAALALAAGGLSLGARRRPALTPSAPEPASRAMDRAQARSILGVPEGAGAEAVDAAYRRLIRRAHPDVGGTAGLAAQLNAARAALRSR